MPTASPLKVHGLPPASHRTWPPFFEVSGYSLETFTLWEPGRGGKTRREEGTGEETGVGAETEIEMKKVIATIPGQNSRDLSMFRLLVMPSRRPGPQRAPIAPFQLYRDCGVRHWIFSAQEETELLFFHSLTSFPGPLCHQLWLPRLPRLQSLRFVGISGIMTPSETREDSCRVW